ncbi:MAG: hypothetical protein NC344_10280 [Bacteroidales bacterium]|nr:hypothetical protein [Bacteroidales bacterium]MCM1148191.1 hypothetical protein [Bacteroidales bacterium]MCM1207082.1 hypothetical protein [Bacillota bacterium]MCM1510826.1 hypothetical protein [Clostridium sp.]
MGRFVDKAGIQLLWDSIKKYVTDGTGADISDLSNRIDELVTSYGLTASEVTQLKSTLNTLVSNPDAAINSFNEITKFLENVDNTQSLEGILAGITKSITDGDAGEAKLRQDGDDEVKALVVKLHAAVTFGASKTTIEKGVSTAVTINHSAKFDGAALTYALEVNGEAVKSSYTISDTTTFSGVFKVDNADPKLVTDIAKSVTVNAYYPKYVGGSTKTTLTSDDITALTKQGISGSASGTANITSADDEYIWFCVPANMTINKVTLGGFAVPLEAAVTVAVTGKGNYKCYRSTNPLSAGARSFVIA